LIPRSALAALSVDILPHLTKSAESIPGIFARHQACVATADGRSEATLLAARPCRVGRAATRESATFWQIGIYGIARNWHRLCNMWDDLSGGTGTRRGIE
jgi:hypothetical protein